jgi:hypothetical protein
MNTTAENVTFMIVRGTVALAIVGLGFYCIAQGIHFLALPQVEAAQLHMHFVGLDISASGLGAVIFGTGIALCFIGQRTVPRTLRITRDGVQGQQSVVTLAAAAESQIPSPASASPPRSAPLLVREEVILTEGSKPPPMRFD